MFSISWRSFVLNTDTSHSTVPPPKKKKRRFYREKVAELEKEVATVHNGSHEELATTVQELSIRRDDQIASADTRLKLNKEAAEREYQAAVEMINLEFIVS
jgi:hypothetical protein